MTNLSNSTNATFYIITPESLERLISHTIALQNITQEIIKERDYLEALNQRYESDSQIFAQAINNSQIFARELLDSREFDRLEYNSNLNNLTIQVQTLKTRVQDVEKNNYEIKARMALWIVVISILVIFITILVVNFIKGKRLYFIARWIRNKIPFKI